MNIVSKLVTSVATISISALMAVAIAPGAFAAGPISIVPSPTVTDSPSSKTTTPQVLSTQTVDQFLVSHPDAKKVSSTKVSWRNGEVIMTWLSNSSSSSTAASTDSYSNGTYGITATDSCDSGWLCFYQARDYGQRKIQFRSCGFQLLRDYGADNGISSWSNKTSHQSFVYDGTNRDTTLLWIGGANSRSSFVGWNNNDRASGFEIIC